MGYSPVEREVLLDLLEGGADVPVNISVRIGRHPRSISRSIRRLRERELVEDKGAKVPVYVLTEAGEEAAADLAARED